MKEAFDEIDGFGPSPALASTFSMLGKIAQAEGNLEEAEKYYTTAVAMNQKSGNNKSIEVATDLYFLSSIKVALGNLDEAETFIIIALNTINDLDLGPNELMIDILERYIVILEKKGQ